MRIFPFILVLMLSPPALALNVEVKETEIMLSSGFNYLVQGEGTIQYWIEDSKLQIVKPAVYTSSLSWKFFKPSSLGEFRIVAVSGNERAEAIVNVISETGAENYISAHAGGRSYAIYLLLSASVIITLGFVWSR